MTKPLDKASPQPVQPASAQALDLRGTSDRMAVTYLAATPSAMAATQASLSRKLSVQIVSEQQSLAASVPPLEAKAPGGAPVPRLSPALPQGVAVSAGKPVAATPPDRVAPPMEAPAAATANAAQDRALDQAPKPSVWDAFKSWISGVVSGLQTRDGGLSTKAGPKERVDLRGAASPQEAQKEADAARASADREEARQQAAFRGHPGQDRVQPVTIAAKSPVALTPAAPSAPAAARDAGMAEYAAAPLPPEVRAHVDARLAVGIAPKLAPQRQAISMAAQKRDVDKARTLAAAKADAQQTVARADAAQRRQVLRERGRIAAEQGKGLAEARLHADTLRRDTQTRGQSVQTGIAAQVQREESRAASELQQGERKAESERKKGEAEAQGLKAGLKAKTRKKSWWGRLKSAVKSAVRAVTKAIDAVFTRVRKAVARIIKAARDAAVGIINAARRAVIRAIDGFRNWAKRQVSTYLGKIAPGLAKRVNSAIDGIADTAIKGVNAVADGAVKAVDALAKGLGKALDKVLQVFQTGLTTGLNVAAALVTGDFAGALREAIRGACKIAGVSPKPVFRLLDKAGRAIGAILKNPVGFARNLFSAVGLGVKTFFGNIGKHLIGGVLGWLTGALPSVGVQGPFSFTPLGIGRIVLQVLGITYANIRARVIKRYPAAEKVIGAVEKGMGLVRTLITKGPIALWGQITKAVGDVKSMVLGAVGKFLSLTVLKEGIIWLLSMLNPASALVKVVKAIFDLVVTVIERFAQLKSFVQTIWSAVSAIIAQKFKAVAKRVEDVLARGLPVVISLLAGVLGLGGIAGRVSGVLKRVTAPVNRVIDKVVDRVVGFARKIAAKGKAGVKNIKKGAKTLVAKIKKFLWPEKTFTGGAEKHRLYLNRKGRKVVPMMRSTPQAIGEFLTRWRAGPLKYQTDNYAKQGPEVQAAWDARKAGLVAAEGQHKQMEAIALRIADALLQQEQLAKQKPPNAAQIKAAEGALAQARKEMLAVQDQIAQSLKAMMGTFDALGAKTMARYKLEGLVANFSSQPNSRAFQVGKNETTKFTGDHMPRGKAFLLFSKKPYFARPEGDKLQDLVATAYYDTAKTILLVESRHKQGRTWRSGAASRTSMTELTSAITALDGRSTDPAQLRRGAVEILKDEARKDADYMANVISPDETAPIWDDVSDFQDKDAKKTKNWKKLIVTKIKAQITRGLGQIRRQPLEYLAGD